MESLLMEKQPVHKSKKHYEDGLKKKSLNLVNISPHNWQFHANDCATWQKRVYDGKVTFEYSWIANKKLERHFLKKVMT